MLFRNHQLLALMFRINLLLVNAFIVCYINFCKKKWLLVQKQNEADIYVNI